jgi:hypothetical protein
MITQKEDISFSAYVIYTEHVRERKEKKRMYFSSSFSHDVLFLEKKHQGEKVV